MGGFNYAGLPPCNLLKKLPEDQKKEAQSVDFEDASSVLVPKFIISAFFSSAHVLFQYVSTLHRESIPTKVYISVRSEILLYRDGRVNSCNELTRTLLEFPKNTN